MIHHLQEGTTQVEEAEELQAEVGATEAEDSTDILETNTQPVNTNKHQRKINRPHKQMQNIRTKTT